MKKIYNSGEKSGYIAATAILAFIVLFALAPLVATVQGATSSTAAAMVNIGVVMDISLIPCTQIDAVSFGSSLAPPLTNITPSGGRCNTNLSMGGASGPNATGDLNISINTPTNVPITTSVRVDPANATTNFLVGGAACSGNGCIQLVSLGWNSTTKNTSASNFNTSMTTSNASVHYGVPCPCGGALVNKSMFFNLTIPTGSRGGTHSALLQIGATAT